MGRCAGDSLATESLQGVSGDAWQSAPVVFTADQTTRRTRGEGLAAGARASRAGAMGTGCHTDITDPLPGGGGGVEGCAFHWGTRHSAATLDELSVERIVR